MGVSRRQLLLDSARLAAGAAAVPLLGNLPEAALGAPPPSVAALGYAPYGDAEYWAFADKLAQYFDPLWEPARGTYRPLGGGQDTRYNGALLTTHAIAALAGHGGATRQDERVRQLAKRLCQTPPFVGTPSPGTKGDQYHVPGWVESLRSTDSPMHVANDPQVAEGLATAWRARSIVGLEPDTIALIEDRVPAVARGAFFRYPSVRLNQINWQSELYAYASTVSGTTDLLTGDYRRQLQRFATGIKRRRKGGTTNLTSSYRFQYLPASPTVRRLNLDSPEYANIVAGFMVFYEQALAAGMQPLASSHMRLLQAWVERILCGYWTHAGYLNWDTGFNLERWQLGQYWSFAQQGLLAIAVSPAFQSRPELGEWAKFFVDRGLGFYRRLADEDDPQGLLAPAVVYSRNITPSRVVFAARMQANAARAVDRKLGHRTGTEPPALYAFDPDIGRLAITTPTYNTAVLPVNQHGTPYGGIELARLYDSDQRILSNIAGRPPASFGMMVTGAHGRRVLVSQLGRARPGRRSPLALLRSPRGVVRKGRRYPTHPYAGAFTTIEARGSVESGDLRLTTTHLFETDRIETRWKLSRKRGRAAYTAALLFPSYSAEGRIEAVLRSNSRVVLAGPGRTSRREKLADVSYFHITSGDAGYVVVPTRRGGGRARTIQPRPQGTAEHPGPTLALELARRSSFRSLAYRARIAPATTRSEAADVAQSLGA